MLNCDKQESCSVHFKHCSRPISAVRPLYGRAGDCIDLEGEGCGEEGGGHVLPSTGIIKRCSVVTGVEWWSGVEWQCGVERLCDVEWWCGVAWDGVVV